MRLSIILSAFALIFPALSSATTQSGSLNGAAGNVSGTMTAGFFSGDGSELTHLSTAPYTPVTCTLPQVSIGSSCVEPSNTTGSAAVDAANISTTGAVVSALSQSTQTLSSVKGASVTCPSGYVVQSSSATGSICSSTISYSGYSTNSGNVPGSGVSGNISGNAGWVPVAAYAAGAGTVTASNVNAGAFAAGTYSFPGSLGIATATPNYPLVVHVGTNENLSVQVPTEFSTGVKLRSATDNNSSFEDMEFAAGAFDFYGGNVGIGSTGFAPVTALDVVGSGEVTSTFTVQGNAFSVGGSSFTVSGGSATVAYGMTAASFSGVSESLTGLLTASSGTFTATGQSTYSVTAASGIYSGGTVVVAHDVCITGGNCLSSAGTGSGNVNASGMTTGIYPYMGSGTSLSNGHIYDSGTSPTVVSSLTVQGAALFQSTITVGPTVFSSTLNYTSAIKGIYGTIVLKSSFTAVSSITIYGFQPSLASEYYVVFVATQNTTGGIYELNLNTDLGSHYAYASYGINTNLSGLSDGSSAFGYWPLVGCQASHNDGVATYVSESHFSLTAYSSGPGVDIPESRSHYFGNGDSLWRTCTGSSIHYNGTLALTNLTIYISAGTMTGYLNIYADIVGP